MGRRRTVRLAIPVGSGGSLNALVVVPSGVKARLRDPHRKVVAAATSTGGFTPLSARIRRRGRWTVELTNPGSAPATAGVVVEIQGDRFKVSPKLRRAHKRLVLTVSVRGAGHHVRAVAVARSLSGQGRAVRLHLRRRGARLTGLLKPLKSGTFVTITVHGSQGTRTATAAAP